ncbi:tetratricopeptide repeat protein [Chloroflexus aurantiacus]
MNAAPIIEFRLFGVPRLRFNQRDIHFRRRQPLAIMAMLALSERSVTRDELIYVLWPDVPQPVGRQRLRRSLWHLRQAIGPLADNVLRDEPGGKAEILSLDTSQCYIDACVFVQLAGQVAELPDRESIRVAEQATQLYTGPLLSGLERIESTEFEHWVLQQRERFARLHLDVWRRLVDGYTAIAHFERAITAAEHALALDPLSEALHRKLMWLYARTGRRADAIHQFAYCTALLREELGLDPEAVTSALYQAILNDQIEDVYHLAFRDQKHQVTSGDAGRRQWPPGLGITHLPALTELLTPLREGLAGTPKVVCIQGAAGSGKSYLVRQVLETIRGAMPEVQIWTASAQQLDTYIPFGMVSDVFNVALRHRLNQPFTTMQAAAPLDPWMNEVVRLLPELRAIFSRLLPFRAPSETVPHLAYRRLLQAIPRAFQALIGTDPVIIALEDIDQADPLSTEAFAWFIRSLSAIKVSLLVTCRDDSAIKKIIADSGMPDRLRSFTIPPIDQQAVLRLAQDAGLSVSVGKQLWQQTQGEPLAIREILRAITMAPASVTPPSSLAEAVHLQLQMCDAALRRIVEVLAVIGCGSGLLIQQVSGCTGDEVEEACAYFQQLDWISTTETQYFIAHPEIRTAILAQLNPARRQQLHRQTASWLRQVNVEPARIAYHLEAAAQPEEAARMWLQAARRAHAICARDAALYAVQRGLGLAQERQTLFDLLCEQETITHDYGLRSEQQMALDALEQLVSQNPDHPEWWIEVYHRRGRNAIACNRWQDAVDALQRAAAHTLHRDSAILCSLARALAHQQKWSEAEDVLRQTEQIVQHQDRDAQIRYWCTYADVEQMRERTAAVEGALKRAVQLSEPTSPLLPQVMFQLGTIAALRNNFSQALLYAQEAQRLFAQRGIPDREAAAAVLVARMLARQHQYDEALAAYQRAYAGYAAIDLRQGMAASRVNMATLLLRLGAFAEGEAMAREAYNLFASIQDGRGMCVAASNIGAALVWVGRGADAEAWLRESYERAVAIPLPAQQAAALANLGAALLQQGRLVEARQMMEQGLALRAEQGHLDVSIDRAFLAMACLHLGDIEAADRHSLDAVEDLIRVPQVENPQQIWFARAQILRAQGRMTEAVAALKSAVECLQRSAHQLPAQYQEQYRTVFTFNRAILRAYDNNVWPDPPMLV